MLRARWRDAIAWIFAVLFLVIGALQVYDMLIRPSLERRVTAAPDRPEFHEQMLQIDPVYIVPKYEQPEVPPEWRRPRD